MQPAMSDKYNNSLFKRGCKFKYALALLAYPVQMRAREDREKKRLWQKS